jgi:hypothetical protein
MLSSKKYTLRCLKYNRESWQPKKLKFKWVLWTKYPSKIYTKCKKLCTFVLLAVFKWNLRFFLLFSKFNRKQVLSFMNRKSSCGYVTHFLHFIFDLPVSISLRNDLLIHKGSRTRADKKKILGSRITFSEFFQFLSLWKNRTSIAGLRYLVLCMPRKGCPRCKKKFWNSEMISYIPISL